MNPPESSKAKLKQFCFSSLIIVYLSVVQLAYAWTSFEDFDKDIDRLYLNHFSDYQLLLENLLGMKEKITEETSSDIKVAYQSFLLRAYVKASKVDQADQLYKTLQEKNTDGLSPESSSLLYLAIHTYFLSKGKHNEMLESAEKALRFSQKAGDDDLIFLSRVYLGESHAAQADNDKALLFLNRAHEMNIKPKRQWVGIFKSALIDRLAGIYTNLQEDDKALALYLSLIPVAEKLNNKAEFATLYYNIAATYRRLKSFKLANDYYTKAHRFATEAGNKMLIAYSTYGQALISLEQKNINEAIEKNLLAKELFSHVGDISMVAYAEYQLALAYQELGKIELAEKNFLSALKTIRDIGNSTLVLNITQFLEELYEKKGDYKSALKYSVMAFDEYKTQFNQERERLTQSISADYENQRAKLKAKILSQENTMQQIEIENKREELQSQRITSIVVLILFLLFGLVSVRFFYNTRRLKRLTSLDPVSGQYNRRYIELSGRKLLEKSIRSRDPLSIILIDIDNFKRINKDLGYDGGNKVLKSVGSILAGTLRPSDVVARFDADTFLLLLPHTSSDEASAVLEQLKQKLASSDWESQLDSPSTESITICAGLATANGEVERFSSLIDNATLALERAKSQGPSSYIVFEKVFIETEKTQLA